MPGLPEQMYCSQQIHIPPKYPFILRQYAKAAIRTQPTDLLRWSSSYFRALSNKIEPPSKLRLEYPIPRNYMGLTPGFLRVLLKQVGQVPFIRWDVLLYKWDGICLNEGDLVKLLLTAGFHDATAIPWLQFVAVCTGHLNDNLTETMIMICNLLTEEPEGGCAMIPVGVFLDLYRFLAQLDCSEPRKVVNTSFFVPVEERSLHMIKTPGYESTMYNAASVIQGAKPSNFSDASAMPPEFQQYAAVQPNAILGTTLPAGPIISNAVSPLVRTSVDIQPEGSGGFEVQEGSVKTDQSAKSSVTVPSGASSASSSVGKSMSMGTSKTGSASHPSAESGSKSGSADTGSGRDVTESQMTFTEQVSRLGKASSHVHLNKYLQDSMPSMTTDMESRFTAGYVESDTNTIFRAILEKPHESGMKQHSVLGELVEFELLPVPGIGAMVDKEIIDRFSKYIKERSEVQHCMVMPRNVNHFMCPPMEEFNQDDEHEMAAFDDAAYPED